MFVEKLKLNLGSLTFALTPQCAQYKLFVLYFDAK